MELTGTQLLETALLPHRGGPSRKLESGARAKSPTQAVCFGAQASRPLSYRTAPVSAALDIMDGEHFQKVLLDRTALEAGVFRQVFVLQKCCSFEKTLDLACMSSAISVEGA